MSQGACSVCAKPVVGVSGELCKDCLGEAGLPPPSPPIRRAMPCARCGHPEIIRVRMRERTSTSGGEQNDEHARPFALTWPLGEKFKALFSMQKVTSAAPQFDGLFGLLEAYVCRSCGATDLFTREPSAIPIHPAHGTELLVAAPAQYR